MVAGRQEDCVRAIRAPLPGDVYTIDADGTNERLLLRRSSDPAWSPNGSKTAFVQGIGDAIAVVDLMTKRIERVLDATKLGASQVGTADDPAWSPDGTRIAFASTLSDFSEIYVVNADGTGLRRLTRNAQTDQSPTWTRDGRIIYAHSPDDGPQRLYVVNSDGRGVRRLGLAH